MGWTSEQIDASLEEIERRAESPIERQFGMAAAVLFCRTEFGVVPQFMLDCYRYDFGITVPQFDWLVALIECDGAEFHSSQKQRSNDLNKDAAAIAGGAIVIRYTGAAIFRDPIGCADEAVRLTTRRWRAWLMGRPA